MNKTKKLRLRKLVRPSLQLRLVMVCAGCAAFSLLFQFVLFTGVMSEALDRTPVEFAGQFVNISGAYMRVLLISLVAVLPLTVLVGVFTSFRFVGPVHGISMFLEKVIRGEQWTDHQLRSGDEYQQLCELVNQATKSLREQNRADDRGVAASEPESEPTPALPSDRVRQLDS